jgi:hypothetical protein
MLTIQIPTHAACAVARVRREVNLLARVLGLCYTMYMFDSTLNRGYGARQIAFPRNTYKGSY